MEQTGPTGTNQRQQCLFGLWNDETGVAGAASPRGHGILFTLFPFSRGSSQIRRSARKRKVVAQSELWPMAVIGTTLMHNWKNEGKMTFKFRLILSVFWNRKYSPIGKCLNRFRLDKTGLLVLDLAEIIYT